jgi:acyl carrier protein
LRDNKLLDMKEELLNKLAEILEVNQVSLNDELESFDEWDSLTALSIIALADSDYNKKLTNNLLKEFKSIENLVNFILN